MAAVWLCSLALVSLVAAAAAFPPPGGHYTLRLVQQEALLAVGDQPPPSPPPQQLLDALAAAVRQLPPWPAVVKGPAGPLLDRDTTTTAAPTTARSERTTRKGLHSFINAPDRPCPNGMLRDVTGQCREPW